MDENKQNRIKEIDQSYTYYHTYFNHIECDIPDDNAIPGAIRLPYDFEIEVAGYDDNHYSMHTSFLQLGYRGIAEICAENAKKQADEERRYMLEKTADVYNEACAYLEKNARCAKEKARTAADSKKEHFLHIAQILHNLAKEPPKTFEEAIILYWFSWRIRSCFGTSTIGRMDMHLYPFYKNDKENGILSDEQAKKLLFDLFSRINDVASGDTLLNVMLGGSDGNGNDLSNELSVLILETQIAINRTEPHINVRFHKNVNKRFYETALRLQMLGHGQATVYNDDIIIPELIKWGFTREDAVNYANDGCTEIIVDGRSVISFFQLDAVKCVETAMLDQNMTGAVDGKPFASLTTFEEVYQAIFHQYELQLRGSMRSLRRSNDVFRDTQITPLFVAGAYPEFRRDGIDPFRRTDLVPVRDAFLGSVPTVADCLAAIKYAVFDKKICTMQTLLDAIKANYEGYEALRLQLKAAPKFGNDDDYVDEIATRFAVMACDVVEEMNREIGMTVFPAFFNYLFKDHAHNFGATPDGRRSNDPICEHYSATPGCARNGPGATLLSAAKGPLLRAIGNSPVYLTLPRNVAPDNTEGFGVLDTLNRSAYTLKIPILNIAIYDVDVLRAAQIHPEKYADVIVRVWGYSARFIDLDRDMQNHIITRALVE